MSARPTIAQLRNELETLRAHCNHVETERDALKARLEAAGTQRPARPAYAPRPATPEQLAFRAAMAAAKDLAMRTGRSVRVGE